MFTQTIRPPMVDRKGVVRSRNGSLQGSFVLLLTFFLSLAGCGGGSSSSGGGRDSPAHGVANISTAPNSYTTAAGVQVTETVSTYTIRGTTCQDLASQPLGVTAHAEYTIYWSFSEGPRTEISIVFSYPIWQPDGTPSPALVAEWNRYIAALEVHENGHRDIGISIANRIMNSGSDSAANEIFRNFSQRDQIYDAETNHGATQGARLNCA